MNTPIGRSLCLLGVLSALLGPALAADRAAPRPAGSEWLAVSDRTLDRMRGGFDAGGGLMVSFGITRAVYINGELVTQMTLNLGRLSELTPAQATQIGRQMAAANLVQNGPRNTFQPGPAGAGYGVVIQNTLNNQQIMSQTVINARSNALGMIKDLNTQSTLNDALARSVAPR